MWYADFQTSVNSKPSDVSVSFSGMLTRPAGHEANAEAEARKNEAEDDAEAQFFRAEAEATIYDAEAEARHVCEQLSVYEHED